MHILIELKRSVSILLKIESLINKIKRHKKNFILQDLVEYEKIKKLYLDKCRNIMLYNTLILKTRLDCLRFFHFIKEITLLFYLDYDLYGSFIKRFIEQTI